MTAVSVWSELGGFGGGVVGKHIWVAGSRVIALLGWEGQFWESLSFYHLSASLGRRVTGLVFGRVGQAAHGENKLQKVSRNCLVERF